MIACAGLCGRGRQRQNARMYIPNTLERDTAWTQQGDVVTGKGDAAAVFRGIQADLNFFADKVGFEAVKVDGTLGPKTLAAIKAV